MMKRNAHYILSTHWDREWYLPFQAFRFRLVQLLDQVLDGMADGRLRGPFTSDGQALLIEDYLEVRPERRAEIEQRARAGMLAIGPWYSVPDEFLVGGESLVRNLRMGIAVARTFGGEPSRAGWVCDQFGHISQLPQIFAGFGIQGTFLWRGVNATATRHFRWRGADGTILPTYRFGDVGYCSFAFRVRRTDRPDVRLDQEDFRANLEQFLAAEAEHTIPPPLLIFDGGDHLAWDTEAYRAVAGYAHWEDAPFALTHSSLDAYLAELLPHAGAISSEISGELREPASMPQAQDRHWLIPGTLASRVWIKQENAACESLLLDWAEPLSAWANLTLNRNYAPGLLDTAWRWLLQNHPHDSMGGCSVDQVHADMRYRFSQCRQIATELANDAAQQLAAAAAPASDGEVRVVVFNPLPRPLAEVVTLDLEIPPDWPKFQEFFGFEPLPALRIYNSTGAELAYQRVSQELSRTRVMLSPLAFPDPQRVHVVRVALPLRIPALGYTTLTLRPGELDALPPHPSITPSARPIRHPNRPGLATSERSMENAVLGVVIEPNGSLCVTDKRNGATYTRLLTFEDSADIGDGWYHGVALADEVRSSTAAPASVALLHDGPQLTSFRIRTELRLPACFDFTHMRRSADEITQLIDSIITLRRDSDRIEVETSVHNLVADHRLRVLFRVAQTQPRC
ncbi:MAG: glycoside hydrolase [Oscillochloris sp.]|nr:glycoside hydrolase [Oscillochloris sp.]